MASELEFNGKTKISVSIIGDAFVDLFCYLGDKGLPESGADVRVDLPVKPVAGGSGLNTATHLASLIENFPFVDGDINDEQMDVTLQTIVNETDDYGQLLIKHAKENNFEMINCRKVDDTNDKEDEKKESAPNEETDQKHLVKSTGHCIVLVKSQDERSFVTHLGIMDSFKASATALHELVNCRSADPSFQNHHHHIHISGYFNIPGFANGNLKRRLNLVREKRRGKSHGFNVYTTTVSLVPQYDATEQWDSGILDLLPFVDFLVLNLQEAGKISKIAVEGRNGAHALNKAVVFAKLADFFDERSPQTYVIVTLGSKGAVLLYGGEVVHSFRAPVKYDSPTDPTGAGDAFASGFIFGVMNWRRRRQHDEVSEIGSVLELASGWFDALEEGLKWGCVTGTACVMKLGASNPSSKEELSEMLLSSLNYNPSVEEDSDSYNTESDSDYDPENDESYEDESQSSGSSSKEDIDESDEE